MKYLLFGIVVLFSVCLHAQETEQPERRQRIYLDDGSVLRGEIMHWDSVSVIVRLENGGQANITPGMITDIEIIGPKKQYAFKELGRYQVTTLGLSARPRFGFNMTYAMGHRFSRLLGVGGGIGIGTFEFTEEYHFIPMFAEARGFLIPRMFTPYYAVRIGAGIAIPGSSFDGSDNKSGLMTSVELGYRFGGTRRTNFFMGIGWHLQKTTRTVRDQFIPSEPVLYEDRITFQRTELRMGLLF